jgi:inosine-uridine nucleoside N-ribohydrolase
VVIEQIDPPRWPRVGAALPLEYENNCKSLHGPTGLGGGAFPCAQLHHPHSGAKLLIDLAKRYPKEVAVLILGPATTVARAIDRDPELPALLQRIIFVGGSWQEPGDASAVAEFHCSCDPAAARQVMKCGTPLTWVPLDVSRKVLFAPSDLGDLLDRQSRTCAFLKKIVPYGIRSTSNIFGIEGFHLKDVAGVIALAAPSAITTRPVVVDVETRGELTRGMCVIDSRPGLQITPNAEMATTIDPIAARDYIVRILQSAV